jgi:cell division protein DivIC
MRKRSIKKRKKRWIFGFIVLLILLFLLSIGKRGFIQHIRIKIEQHRLKREIASLEKEKERLEEEKKKLDDPEHIEKIAREKYGMAKKNEKVYHVVPEKKESGN